MSPLSLRRTALILRLCRNNSAYIQYVAEEIAEIKGITYEEVVACTEENARRLYGC